MRNEDLSWMINLIVHNKIVIRIELSARARPEPVETPKFEARPSP